MQDVVSANLMSNKKYSDKLQDLIFLEYLKSNQIASSQFTMKLSKAFLI